MRADHTRARRPVVRRQEHEYLGMRRAILDREIRTADEMEILEVSTPGQMGTRPCDPPAGWKD